MNLNRVLLAGHLTRDPELRQTAGQPLAVFGLAINRRFKPRDGEERDETTFVDCETWGRTAEAIAEHFGKGSPIFVEGRLKLDQWEDAGQKRSKLKVVVERFEFVESGKGAAPKATKRRAAVAVPVHGDVSEADIPF